MFLYYRFVLNEMQHAKRFITRIEKKTHVNKTKMALCALSFHSAGCVAVMTCYLIPHLRRMQIPLFLM